MASIIRPRHVNINMESSNPKQSDAKVDNINHADANSGNSTTPHNTQPPPSTTQAKHKTHPQLISYHDLPEWYEGNEYIHHGYRPPSYSLRVSGRSLLTLHNETINIYTHLLPAILFLASPSVILYYLHQSYLTVNTTDDIILVLFALTAAVCLSFSACYHTFTNHSKSVDEFWLRMDFAGIVLLTVGDVISGIYMVFWCESVERIAYWSMVSRSPFSSTFQF